MVTEEHKRAIRDFIKRALDGGTYTPDKFEELAQTLPVTAATLRVWHEEFSHSKSWRPAVTDWEEFKQLAVYLVKIRYPA